MSKFGFSFLFFLWLLRFGASSITFASSGRLPVSVCDWRSNHCVVTPMPTTTHIIATITMCLSSRKLPRTPEGHFFELRSIIEADDGESSETVFGNDDKGRVTGELSGSRCCSSGTRRPESGWFGKHTGPSFCASFNCSTHDDPELDVVSSSQTSFGCDGEERITGKLCKSPCSSLGTQRLESAWVCGVIETSVCVSFTCST
mmetsp:Transcript_837/g.1752  ORF Transcript_837/g.1752 Transcript_837/m.1752 type:complete len:202 (+) Transcript_837:201-806(+)